MNVRRLATMFTLAAIAPLASSLSGAEPIRSNSVAPDQPAAALSDASGQRINNQFVRSSAVSKLSVRNSAGEKIGTIEDLVISIDSGKVSYAALGFGGFLGMGEKLFAVPWNQLQVRTDHDEHYFVLNVSKDALKAAPGFDFADPNFTDRLEKYYRDAGNPPHKVSIR